MLKVAKVTGLNSDTHSAQAFISPKPNQLFVLIYCEGEDVFAKSRQVISEAEDIYTTTPGSISEKIQEVFKTIEQSLEGTDRSEFLIAALSDKNALYLMYKGEKLDALLIRPQGLSNLLAISAEGLVISGFIHPGDKVIFETGSLREVFDTDWEQLILTPVESFTEEVESRLTRNQLTPLAAIMLEDFGEESAEQVTIPNLEDQTRGIYKRGNLQRVSSVISSVFRYIIRSKKRAVFYGTALLIVVAVGILLSFFHKRSSQADVDFNTNLQEAKSAYEQAISLKELNPLSARQSLEQSKTALAKAIKIKPKDRQALELKKAIDENSTQIIKSYQVEDPALWLDLTLIKKDLKTDSLSLSVGQILLLDQDQKTLININAAKKSNQILSGQEKLKDATLASLNGDFAYVYSKDLGVIQIDTTNQNQKVVIKKDEEWGSIQKMYVFAGNIYLLDFANSQILKYLSTSTGFSGKRGYFTSAVRTSLSDVINMQIDASVWVLKSSGEIIKYTQGSPDYFSLSGLETPLKNPASFFVSSETDNLYVLDAVNSRVVVLDKKGTYQKEFKNNMIKSFLDMVVDEAAKKVYFLDGTKIYLMELK